jgi:predicted DNA-binding transcriptional regulator AlpA
MENSLQPFSFPLLDKAALARRYGVSESAVDKWMAQRKIPFFRLGTRCVRFDPVLCDHWVQKMAVAPLRVFLRKRTGTRLNRTGGTGQQSAVQLALPLRPAADPRQLELPGLLS